jgi:peptidoglycan L-alanyl-D-glutamate endopeptidase CwlK
MTWRTDPTVPCRDLNELEPVTRAAVKAYCAAAKRKGYNLLVYETVRTAARQRYLFQQGRTRPGAIVTYTLDSCHLYLMAIDLVPLNKNGSANWAGYKALHRDVPPKQYGLEILNFEKPHMQRVGANGANQKTTAGVFAKKLGLKIAYPG